MRASGSSSVSLSIAEERDRDSRLRGELEQPLLDAVRRAVVDHDHLLAAFRGEHGADRRLDELRRLVEARDQDGDLLACVRREAARADVVQEEEAEEVPRVDEQQDEVAEVNCSQKRALLAYCDANSTAEAPSTAKSAA
jgi:hypothetical protein